MSILIVAFIALAGCGKPSTPDQPSKQPEAIKNVEKEEMERERYEESANDTMEADADFNNFEVSECITGCAILESGTGLMSKEFCEGSCWAAQAQAQKDITICDTKVDKNDVLLQSACRMNVAEATGDTKNCDGITDTLMKDGCYSNVAKVKQDPSICEAIKGSFLYESCVEEAQNL